MSGPIQGDRWRLLAGISPIQDDAQWLASTYSDDLTAARRLVEIDTSTERITEKRALALIRHARILADHERDTRRPFVIRWRDALSRSRVPPTRRHVLLALSLYGGRQGTQMHPSAATLARDTGLSLRTVEGQLRKAEEEGWFSRVAQAREGKAWRRYRYSLQIPPELQHEVPHDGARQDAESHHEGAESDDDGTAPRSAKSTRETMREKERRPREDIEVKQIDGMVQQEVPHDAFEEVL